MVVVMGAIILWMLKMMEESGKPGITARFNGTKSEALAALGILGAVFIFGAMSVINGLWQLIFGRRNLVLIYGILTLAALLFVGGYIVLGVFKH